MIRILISAPREEWYMLYYLLPSRGVNLMSLHRRPIFLIQQKKKKKTKIDF